MIVSTETARRGVRNFNIIYVVFETRKDPLTGDTDHDGFKVAILVFDMPNVGMIGFDFHNDLSWYFYSYLLQLPIIFLIFSPIWMILPYEVPMSKREKLLESITPIAYFHIGDIFRREQNKKVVLYIASFASWLRGAIISLITI